MPTRGQTLRVTIDFGDANPAVDTILSGAPSSGDVIELNANLYRVETVTWPANPAPMRASDLILKVRPESPTP